mgnify:CR=1 FL=1
MLTSGAVPGQMIAYVLGVTAVIIVSWRKGSALGWTRTDTVCLSGVVVAIALWALLRNPDVAIVVNLIAITVGSYPMWMNMWKDPRREPLLPWCLSLGGGAFGVLAIRAWTITEAVTPVTFVCLQIFTIALILRRFLRSQAVA